MSATCEEEAALPAHRAPRPLAQHPDLAEAHPLLDISLTPDKGGGILRRQASERRKGQRQVRFDVNDETSETEGVALPGALAAPRMHSSEALKQEVESQAQQEFDVDSAMRSELGRSYRVKQSVETKACRALNVGRVQSLYRGLVSVEPPTEHVQRLTARHRRPEQRETQIATPDAPDISAFSDAIERFTETPYLGVDGLPPLTLQPRIRPAQSVFTMFHKLQDWAS